MRNSKKPNSNEDLVAFRTRLFLLRAFPELLPVVERAKKLLDEARPKGDETNVVTLSTHRNDN